MPFWHDDIGKHFDKVMKDTDALLLGRKTWQIHSVFERMDGEHFADIMNKLHKYVVSTTLKSADAWRNSTLISKNIVEEINRLKNKPGKNILMDGSSVLVQTMVENNLIDEFRFHIYPIVLGMGKRLFPKTCRVDLKLAESKALPTGVIYVEYIVTKKDYE